MAHITGLYLRGKKYWFNYQIAGKRTRLPLGTADLSQALEQIEEIRSGTVSGTTETLAAMISSYTHDRLKNNRFTDSTSRAVTITLNDLGAYCTKIPIPNVSTAHVQNWFKKIRQRSSEATAQTHLNRARGFFKWCRERGFTTHNPCANVTIGTLPKRAMHRFCTKTERDKLIKAAPAKSELRFILFCGFYAGMRRGEISEARPDWFDLKRKLLHVRTTDTFTAKDREERTIPLAREFLTFLRDFPMTDKYCLAGTKEQRGRSIYRYDFRRPFTDHTKTCNLSWVTPHTMRHTFASLLASEGKSIYKIAVWLGDSVKVVQTHYAKLLPGDDDINALR